MSRTRRQLTEAEDELHVVVVGASGRTGRLVIEQASEAGHRVTAVVRSPDREPLPADVHLMQADVVADSAFELPTDADVVISALGKRSNRDRAPVCERGTTNVIASMRRNGIRRLIVVSASPVLRSGAGEPAWFRLTVRPCVRLAGRHIYADLEAMETLLRESGNGIDWTVVRPGYLVDRMGGSYDLRLEMNAMGVVHRADLAHALLAIAERPGAAGRAFGLASRAAASVAA
ncbi:NAD(P)H-binding protein [Agromyces sp. NPDC049794]|uniref:NAD(P)-dependent oxidoreductase n=1 Tax=unclassified Agromyces TaxID=2639701 RepID=UPI0033DDDFE3